MNYYLVQVLVICFRYLECKGCYVIITSLSPCYASWHIGQGQVSSTLLCCWLFFLLCPRCVLFPLFHFRWWVSILFLVFLFLFSLLVSILGLPLSCLQVVYVEHDQAISISFESIKSPCPWCLWCYYKHYSK